MLTRVLQHGQCVASMAGGLAGWLARWLAGGCLAPRVWRRWREDVSPSHCICARPAGRTRTRVHSRQHAEPHWRPGSLCGLSAGISACLGCGGCMLQADLGRWCREDLHKLQVNRPPTSQHAKLASGNGHSVRLRLFGVAKGPRHQDRLPRSEGWRLCCRRHPQPSPRTFPPGVRMMTNNNLLLLLLTINCRTKRHSGTEQATKDMSSHWLAPIVAARK